MIDTDLSHRLHELAASVDPRFDAVGLRRRIASRARRRQAVKVGVAGAGVAAMVGGLVAVREHGPGASNGVAAAGPASGSGDPIALEACDVVLTHVRAAIPTPDVAATKPVDPNPTADERGFDERGFKGMVTLLSVDGTQVTFRVDDADPAAVTSGAAVLEPTTSWVDAGVPLVAPPALAVGESIGLATTPGADGVDHVLLVDIGAPAPPVDEPESKTPPDSPDPDVAPAAVGKSMATVSSVDPTSITVALTDESAPTSPVTIDPAATPFYAGNTQCAPGALTVGTQLGVGYHIGDAGQVVADIVILMP